MDELDEKRIFDDFRIGPLFASRGRARDEKSKFFAISGY